MLLTDPEAAHLLVIGAYRGNRVDERHGVTRLLAELADRRVTVSTIALGDLSRADLTTMLADTVRAHQLIEEGGFGGCVVVEAD